MTDNIWEEFDKNIDVEGLKKDALAAMDNKKDFKDIPVGNYEVKLHKLELKKSKGGAPMLSAQLKVLTGEYEKQNIFLNQVLTTGFGVNAANEFLESLKSNVKIEWITFKELNDIILNVMENVTESKLEYGVEYTENSKGYKNIKITNVFDW